MSKYFIRRALGVIPTLFIIITLSFFIMRAAPGGPFDAERKIPEQILRNIEAKYNYNDPLLVQYGKYMLDVLRGDLGPSFRYQDHDVNFFIFTSLPNSLILGGIALVLAMGIGMSAGIVSALRQNTLIDYGAMSIAVIGLSVPTFVVGPVLMYVFALQLGWLPTSGWLRDTGGWINVIMPVVTLAAPYFAVIARLTRASLLEVLQADYIRTARAKGLAERTVIVKHALKGASLPVISYLGPAFAAIVTGSVVVEQIFRVPGLGRFFVQAAFNRDYTLLMGTVIVYSVILVLLNLIVDMLYGVLDPRISYR